MVVTQLAWRDGPFPDFKAEGHLPCVCIQRIAQLRTREIQDLFGINTAGTSVMLMVPLTLTQGHYLRTTFADL